MHIKEPQRVGPVGTHLARPLQTLAVDFIADNPGDSLMHCHQQLHMDYGFMQIVKYKPDR